MEVANPIYDAVFKYLMEDDRVARTILGALLKKAVTSVEMRPHEYSNSLDEILSIFDQSQTTADTNDHTIFIDEDRYAEEDAEMQRILRRLLMVAVSSDIRQDMNVEDEYYSYLEQKETEVMMKDRIIAQQDAQLSEQKEQLSQQKKQLSQQKEQLSQQKEQLSQKDAQLSTSIRLLLDAGLSAEKVAESLAVDIDTIMALSK